jgi:hypothetical protein
LLAPSRPLFLYALAQPVSQELPAPVPPTLVLTPLTRFTSNLVAQVRRGRPTYIHRHRTPKDST